MYPQFIPCDSGKISEPVTPGTGTTPKEPMQNRYIVQRFIYSEDGQEGWRIRDTEQGNKIMCTCLNEENAKAIQDALNLPYNYILELASLNDGNNLH